MKIIFTDRTVEAQTSREAMSIIYASLNNPEQIVYSTSEKKEAEELEELMRRYCINLRIKMPKFKEDV